MNNSKLLNKSLLCTSILMTLGAYTGAASAVSQGVNNNNFTMLDPAGGGVGGTSLVQSTWDGTYNTDVGTAVSNMTISSQVPFFGQPWNAHDVKVFGPGTYVFETCPAPIVGGFAADGSRCTGGVSAPLSMTVGVGQVGAHMLFDWNGNLNIDVVNVWEVNSVWAYGPNDATSTSMLRTSDSACIGTGKGADLGTPECVAFFATEWQFTAVDVNGDGIPGSPMVDGPFTGFNGNFNIQKESVYDDALIAVKNTSEKTDDLLANDQLLTVLGAGTFTISAYDATTVEGGSVSDNGDGTLNYLPPLDYVGVDSFTYTVDDGVDHSDLAIGAGGSFTATATVSIEVFLIDPRPTVTDDSVTTEVDTPVTTVDLLANDTLPANGETFAISAFDAASVSGGTVTDNGDNTMTYTPASGYIGMDSFTYTIDDGKGHSATATVDIVITAAAVVTPTSTTPATTSSGSASLFMLLFMSLLLPLRLMSRKIRR